MTKKNELEPLSSGPWTDTYVCLAQPGGGDTLSISGPDLKRFKRDPDLFAARYFGLEKAAYREWVETDGTPLCAAITRRKTLCRNAVGPI